MVAELLLPEASELADTDGVELDFSLGCQGGMDAGAQPNRCCSMLCRVV